MKPFATLACACVLMLCASLACAQIPPLLEVPTAESANARLAQDRRMLEAERATLRSESEAHNARCRSVKQGSAEDGACVAAQGELRTRVARHVERSNAFNDAVRAAAAAGGPTARVQSEGEVSFTSADGRALPATGTTPFAWQPGMQVRTGPTGRATLTFADGSRVTLAPNTLFTVREVAGANVVVDMLSDVVRWATGAAARPTVRMPTVVIAVRGTDFECAAAQAGSDSVKVYSGEVDLTLRDGRIVTVKSGNMVTIAGNDVAGPAPLQ